MRDEIRLAPGLDDLVSGLPVLVQLPVEALDTSRGSVGLVYRRRIGTWAT